MQNAFIYFHMTHTCLKLNYSSHCLLTFLQSCSKIKTKPEFRTPPASANFWLKYYYIFYAFWMMDINSSICSSIGQCLVALSAFPKPALRIFTRLLAFGELRAIVPAWLGQVRLVQVGRRVCSGVEVGLLGWGGKSTRLRWEGADWLGWSCGPVAQLDSGEGGVWAGWTRAGGGLALSRNWCSLKCLHLL